VNPMSPQFEQLLSTASGGRYKPVAQARRQTSAALSTASAEPLHEGTVIEHQRFGIGTVERLEGVGENQKATVNFRNAGTKQLLLKYAVFKIVTP